MIIELKNKLDSLPVIEKEIALTDDETEIFEALKNLGYQEKTSVKPSNKFQPILPTLSKK